MHVYIYVCIDIRTYLYPHKYEYKHDIIILRRDSRTRYTEIHPNNEGNISYLRLYNVFNLTG